MVRDLGRSSSPFENNAMGCSMDDCDNGMVGTGRGICVSSCVVPARDRTMKGPWVLMRAGRGLVDGI